MRLCNCMPIPYGRGKIAPLFFTFKNGGDYAIIEHDAIVIDFEIQETLSSGVEVTFVAANGFNGWMRPIDLFVIDESQSTLQTQ